MSFPRYPRYKDSGVEWLGEVPEHWQVTRLKGTLDEIDLRTGEEARELLGLSKSLGVVRRSDLEQSAATADDYSKYKIVEPGQLVMNRMQAWNGVFGLSGIAGIVSPDYSVLAIRRAGYDRFLTELFKTPQAAGVFLTRSRGMGTAFLRLNTRDLLDISVALPPPEEAEAIASFLDCESAKIDALVAEQERLIELLKVKRQAVISNAVTKGLNPVATMKDSGVEWLGEVPAHWAVLPIRKVAKLESGHTPSRSKPEYWVDCTFPWFTLSDVWQIREAGLDEVAETKEKVSALGLESSSARLLPKGTVMLSRTASVGFAAIMGTDMATTQDFANWVCGPRLLPEFLLQALRSMGGELRRLMMGSTHNTVYMPDIQGLQIALPPIDEQMCVVEYVGRRKRGFDDLIADASAMVTLLRERRSALISAAVTGQIDVRHLAPAEAA